MSQERSNLCGRIGWINVVDPADRPYQFGRSWNTEESTTHYVKYIIYVHIFLYYISAFIPMQMRTNHSQ